QVVKSVDDFLSPADKLRGIFLQKFCGKSAVFNALNGVQVELNDELLVKVMNEGNLSGDSIVLFFNWALDQPNVSEKVSIYNSTIKALGKRKFFKHMMQVLNGMKDKAISPNADTLFIVMNSYLRARQVSKAVKIFGELEKYGFQSNSGTISVALNCLSRHSYVGAACSLFNKLRQKSRQRDCSIYNIMIGGWSKMGRISQVERLVKLMVDDGVDPDCITYSHVIEVFGRAGRVDSAIEIFKHLEEKGNSTLSPEVYNAVIFSCLANDKADEGLKYYEEMQRKGFDPNAKTYTGVISSLLRIRKVADAIEMFDEMVSKEMIPSAGTLTKFIEPLCRYGPPHAALMIYSRARKAGCLVSDSAYKLLLMRLGRFGKCGMLLKIWEESGYPCDLKVYEYMINGLCNVGKLETAVVVMEDCVQRGLFPGKIICSKLKNKLMSSGKVEIAYKLFLKLRNARAEENARRYWRSKGWHF
ncbi:hypothetical protein M569_04016, partial [Genlisea aurea]